MSNHPQFPDFGNHFRTEIAHPIDFTCREGPNFFHDLVFLGSYIHDANFQIKQMGLRGKTLKIPMFRDRWELFKSSGKLETIASMLALRPVLSVKWEFKGKVIRKRSTRKIEDRHVHLGESFWDNTDVGEIVFIGHGTRPTKLRVALADPLFLHLIDSLANPQNSP